MGKKLDTKLAGQLYSENAGDKAIAEACGVTVATVQSWRKRCGLPANFEPKSEEHLTQLEKDAIAARKAGLTYGQYKARQYDGSLLKRRII